MPDIRKIGSRIKTLRTDHKMTQAELAKQLGITRQAVCNYETGDSVPSDEIKVAIARLFKTSIESIFFADEVNKKNTKEL